MRRKNVLYRMVQNILTAEEISISHKNRNWDQDSFQLGGLFNWLIVIRFPEMNTT